MVINEQTKIAELLKHHPDVLEAIVALSPDFKKLRNPILRRLMAGRTTIRMASKIGGCSPADFFTALAPFGFETGESAGSEPDQPLQEPRPDYLQDVAPGQVVLFDVREMLAAGNDPLRPIQEKIKSLGAGQVLKIINTFEPVPLIKLLERKGFKAWVNFVDADTVETWFFKAEAGGGEEVMEPTPSSDGWEGLLQHFKNRLEEVDVRVLEMPGPMMTILEKLETLQEGSALYVYHKRIPVFLLTELKERGWEYRIKEIQDGEVYLLIFKEENTK